MKRHKLSQLSRANLYEDLATQHSELVHLYTCLSGSAENITAVYAQLAEMEEEVQSRVDP